MGDESKIDAVYSVSGDNAKSFSDSSNLPATATAVVSYVDGKRHLFNLGIVRSMEDINFVMATFVATPDNMFRIPVDSGVLIVSKDDVRTINIQFDTILN